MPSEYPNRKIQSRAGAGHKFAIWLFFLWALIEISPAFIPASWSGELYDTLYFIAEDSSTIILALACYCSLSYASTALKGVALGAVILSSGLMLTNFLFDVLNLPQTHSMALGLAFVLSAIQFFVWRFLLHLEDGQLESPEDDTVYLVINKPHNFTGMIGLLWSGIGGGFSAYVNGDCYWFSREKGVLVKTHDPSWRKGKRMINCGRVSEEKILDLESMIGQKWSPRNNCFTVFSAWRRRWA